MMELENFLDLIPDPAAIMDTKGKILTINKEAEKASGFKKEDLVGKNVIRTKILTARSKGVVLKNITKSTLGLPIPKLEVELLKKNGKLKRWVEVKTKRIKVEEKTAILVIFRDVTERKDVEENLRKSEIKYRSLIEYASAGVANTDIKGRFTYVNKALCEMLGYTEADFIGKPFVSFLHPDDKKDLIKKFLGAWRFPRHKYKLRFRTIHKDGHPVYMFSAPTLFMDKKEILGFNAIVEDISQLQEIEENLRKSEESYKHTSNLLNNILSNMEDYVMMIDENYNFRFINEPTRRLYGDVIGKKCYRVVRNANKPCYKSGIPCEVYEVLKKGADYFEDTRIASATGRISQVRARPTRMVNGKRAIITVASDITEREITEEKIKESEKMYHELFDGSRDAIIISTPEGKIKDANQSMLDLFGFKKEEMMSINAKQLYANPGDRVKYKWELEKRNFVKDFDAKFRKKNGEVMDCLLTSTVRRVKGSKNIEYQAIIRDITKSKKMEDELKRYSKYLEEMVEERTRRLRDAERLATIGKLAAMVGHDLRNPLQSLELLMYLEREMFEKMPPDCMKIAKKHGAENLLKDMDEQLNYMNKIISDLQDFTKPIKLEFEKADISHLINDTLKAIKVPRTIKTSIVINKKLPKINVDPELIKRVLYNIILNAIQAIQNKGQLFIRVSKLKNAILISIKDTGSGMSKDVKDKLFQPFFTTKSKGIGLGLSVCKRLIDAHKGSISVESREGRGSTFKIELPLDKGVIKNGRKE